MPKRTDQEREDRIENEIVVDAHGEEERAMGWFYYLEENLHCPFTAHCIAKRASSPLKVGDEVEVIGMSFDDECLRELFVTIRWEKDGLAVPLSQLKPGGDADDSIRQAVNDWHYWVEQGYEF